MERDPYIVSRQQKTQQLQILLEKQVKANRPNYLLDVKRELSVVKGKADQIKSQLVAKSKVAQVFNQSLEQFRRLDDELNTLQTQTQTPPSYSRSVYAL